MSDRPHHRPAMPGAGDFEAIESSDPAADPALSPRPPTAPRWRWCAALATRPTRRWSRGWCTLPTPRVSRRSPTSGPGRLPTRSPACSGGSTCCAAGCTPTRRRPRASSTGGRALAPVAEAISGVEEPPGPDEVRALVDAVLSGVVTGDFADTLFRASAFARVAAAGRAQSTRPTSRLVVRTRTWRRRGCSPSPSSCSTPARLELDGTPRSPAASTFTAERLEFAVRRAVAAPGPKISRYERPRAVRRSRPGAPGPPRCRPRLASSHGPRNCAALVRPSDPRTPRIRTSYAPRRNGKPDPGEVVLGLGALRGRPDAGQGPAGAGDRVAPAGTVIALPLTSKDHDHDAAQEARGGPVLDGRRHRRLGPPAPSERGQAEPRSRPRLGGGAPRGRRARARVFDSVVEAATPYLPEPQSLQPSPCAAGCPRPARRCRALGPQRHPVLLDQPAQPLERCARQPAVGKGSHPLLPALLELPHPAHQLEIACRRVLEAVAPLDQRREVARELPERAPRLPRPRTRGARAVRGAGACRSSTPGRPCRPGRAAAGRPRGQDASTRSTWCSTPEARSASSRRARSSSAANDVLVPDRTGGVDQLAERCQHAVVRERLHRGVRRSREPELRGVVEPGEQVGRLHGERQQPAYAATVLGDLLVDAPRAPAARPWRPRRRDRDDP